MKFEEEAADGKRYNRAVEEIKKLREEGNK